MGPEDTIYRPVFMTESDFEKLRKQANRNGVAERIFSSLFFIAPTTILVVSASAVIAIGFHLPRLGVTAVQAAAGMINISGSLMLANIFNKRAAIKNQKINEENRHRREWNQFCCKVSLRTLTNIQKSRRVRSFITAAEKGVYTIPMLRPSEEPGSAVMLPSMGLDQILSKPFSRNLDRKGWEEYNRNHRVRARVLRGLDKPNMTLSFNHITFG